MKYMVMLQFIIIYQPKFKQLFLSLGMVENARS